MLDKTIPYRNIIMKYSDFFRHDLTARLPEGYGFRMYREGDESEWAKIQIEAGEFLEDGEAAATEYFRRHYMGRLDELKKRCVFCCDFNGNPVGVCTAWLEEDEKGNFAGQFTGTASLHWLAVKESAQHQGVGYALILETLRIFAENGEMPVYLHTQPWSYAAVKLYMRAGFQFCRKESFARYENQYDEAMEILKEYIMIPAGSAIGKGIVQLVQL